MGSRTMLRESELQRVIKDGEKSPRRGACEKSQPRKLTVEQKQEGVRRLRNLLLHSSGGEYTLVDEQLEVWLDQFVECVQFERGTKVVYALVRETGEVEAVFTSARDAGEVSKSWPRSTIQQTWLNEKVTR